MPCDRTFASNFLTEMNIKYFHNIEKHVSCVKNIKNSIFDKVHFVLLLNGQNVREKSKNISYEGCSIFRVRKHEKG